MEWFEFYSRVEETIRNVITDNTSPQYWDENFLTLNIVKELNRRLPSVSIDDLDTKLQIQWLAFKSKLPLETKFGDLAILVHIKFQDGQELEGVCFLEAKKRTQNSSRFDFLDFKQLRRINKHTLHSMVLLYDYQDVPGNSLAKLHYDESLYRLPHLQYLRGTKSVVAQTNTVLTLGRKDTSLYQISLPFSYQLCYRYLQGLDLELRTTPINIAKGYVEQKLGRPSYLLIMSVVFGLNEFSEMEFNKETFERLSE